jgi:hypothetical protein
MKFFAAIALLCASGVSGFVAPSASKQSTTSLSMSPEEGMKKAAVSFMAAAFLAGNLAAVEPAFAAADDMDFGSSQVVAARSGGRAGGRSSAPRRAPSRSSYSAPSQSRTVINRTYMQPSPVIVAPPIYGGGFGYNPMGGLGTNT